MTSSGQHSTDSLRSEVCGVSWKVAQGNGSLALVLVNAALTVGQAFGDDARFFDGAYREITCDIT
eukprot:747972-Hanusia_phi.AAC.1